MQALLGDAHAGRAAHGDIGFATAAGFVTVVAGCLVATWLYPPGVDVNRLIVLSVVVIVFAAVVQDSLAALVTAGLAWPFYLGFLVDRYGELHWHGRIDLLRLAVLAVAALIGTVRPGRGPRSWSPQQKCLDRARADAPNHGVSGGNGASWGWASTPARRLSPIARVEESRVMADVVFVLLTVAVFALFGLIVRAVGRL